MAAEKLLERLETALLQLNVTMADASRDMGLSDTQVSKFMQRLQSHRTHGARVVLCRDTYKTVEDWLDRVAPSGEEGTLC